MPPRVAKDMPLRFAAFKTETHPTFNQMGVDNRYGGSIGDVQTGGGSLLTPSRARPPLVVVVAQQATPPRRPATPCVGGAASTSQHGRFPAHAGFRALVI